MFFWIVGVITILVISNNYSERDLESGYVHDSIYDDAKNAKSADEYYKLTRPIDEYNEMTKNDIWK